MDTRIATTSNVIEQTSGRTDTVVQVGTRLQPSPRFFASERVVGASIWWSPRRTEHWYQ